MIRRATSKDIDFAAELGREMFAASHWSGVVDYDEDRVKATLGALIASDQAAVFLSERGLIVVLLVPLWFSGDITAQELFFWTLDGAGTALRRAAEQWASDQGAIAVVMGAHEPGNMDLAERWYRRGGYAPHGRTFRKVLR